MDDLAVHSQQPVKLETEAVNLYYGSFQALRNVSLAIPACTITAIIGPSGCGKSTLLRVFNRMNDLIPKVRVEGQVLLDGDLIYGKNTDVVALRKRVGMVFQRPNPFPMSVFDNIAFGPRKHGIKHSSELADIVERCLSQVALWEEVKDKLKNQPWTSPQANSSGCALPVRWRLSPKSS